LTQLRLGTIKFLAEHARPLHLSKFRYWRYAEAILRGLWEERTLSPVKLNVQVQTSVPRLLPNVKSRRLWLASPRDKESSLHPREPIEALFLLISEWAIEFLQSRLYNIDRAQHGIEPLLHGLDAHYRGNRPIGRSVHLEQLACLGDSVPESA
jgi:hypothetical protein